MSTGHKIREIRKKKGISQYELADKLNYLNQSQLSKIEKGDRKITDKDLIEFSKALGVTIDELIKNKEVS